MNQIDELMRILVTSERKIQPNCLTLEIEKCEYYRILTWFAWQKKSLCKNKLEKFKSKKREKKIKWKIIQIGAHNVFAKIHRVISKLLAHSKCFCFALLFFGESIKIDSIKQIGTRTNSYMRIVDKTLLNYSTIPFDGTFAHKRLVNWSSVIQNIDSI